MRLRQILKLGKLSLKYFKVMYLLYSGETLLIYGLYHKTEKAPIITLVGEKDNWDCIELDCIPEEKLDTYIVEKPIANPEYIQVTGYRQIHDREPILFIYLEGNSIKARLADGRTIDYSLSILDIEHMNIWGK